MFSGAKHGNRHTHNIKSLGYADMYVLRREHLWHVLANYPDSLSSLIEKGKSILRSDNLLDETLVDIDRHVEHQSVATMNERIERLSMRNRSLNGRMRRFADETVDALRRFEQQLDHLERQFDVSISSDKATVRRQLSTLDLCLNR
jgi:predicted nuclease with TOPRIM domain